jgi:predicted flavoprotein YhiN
LMTFWLQQMVKQMPAIQPTKTRWADVTKAWLQQFAKTVTASHYLPSGSEGHKKAEVTRGGIDTTELSSQTMASLKQPNLYFIGEVVDVTGWLGGYNFQWAWASAVAAAKDLIKKQSI